MERQYVESSNIKSIGFDESTSVLEVEFNNCVVWQYYDVPEYIWYEFLNAEYKGKFFNANIKNAYNGQRVE